MKRTIELWIGDLRADLADDGFLLMNYTMEDLASPAVVRNAFSKQVTLPGTSANNRIFGEIFRNDRVTQYSGSAETGVYFDPTRKTTWRIYDGQSQILDSGYLRLDSVTRKRNVIVDYKVTLYGGLGQFLYGLAYDANGEKRTLAGLNFRGTNDPDNEFNFTLNANAVRDAWTRAAGAAGTPTHMWHILNFAPCYNGKPKGAFDANKALMNVVTTGIDSQGTGTIDGLALVTLAKYYTEWETKDLRSYLQRPVVRLRSIIEAACAARNNGGWDVTLDPAFFNDNNPYWDKTWLTLPIVETENLINDGTGSDEGRYHTAVTKQTLLSGGGTPADYLTSFCKTFGLVIVADSATKKVSIEKRSTFYTGEVVDITDRVDTDEGIEKVPFAFSAKWYVWAANIASGEWAKAYAERYGRTFGQRRVDTGYSFDANETAVLKDVIFHGCATVLEQSKYFCTLEQFGNELPSVLLDRGAKYSRSTGQDETEDVDIVVPDGNATMAWMNPRFDAYDLFPKPQFHGEENAPSDERDTILFLNGMTATGAPYTLTDDVHTALSLNQGVPCWLLLWGAEDSSTVAPPLPKFSRYIDTTEQHQGEVYAHSLDFGTPVEIPIPDVTFEDGATIWDACFAAYVADRYDDDSAVVRCKVNLAGMQVGHGLFRRFYYFDGAVWALNKITNYSMTTWDLTECEFVKVQDVENYTE